MEKVKEYKIVHASTYSELENLVNGLIKEGWQPLGGVNSNIWQVNSQFKGSSQQAMVR